MKQLTLTISFLLHCVIMLATDYKTGSDNGFVCTWAKEDVAGIYTTGGTRIKHWVETVDDDAHYAQFTSGAWSLVANTNYYAYYPYSSYYYDNDCPITALPITYDSQKQSGNDDMKHLAAYDFMIAKGQTTASAAEFTMRHLGSILHIQLLIPQNKAALKPTSLKLSLPSAVIPVTANMNLPEQKLVPLTTAKELTLQLDNTNLGSGNILTAYMMTAPFTCFEEHPTLTLYAGEKEMLSVELDAKEFTEGHCYFITNTAASAGKRANTHSGKSARSIQSTLQKPVIQTTDFIPATVNIVTGIDKPAITEKPTSTNRYFTIDGKPASSTTHGIVINKGKKHVNR